MSKRIQKKRLIGKIEIKGNAVIKGIQYDGYRVIGEPLKIIRQFVEFGVDEIVIEDTIASYYGIKSDLSFIREYNGILPPLTVGGGIKNIKDAEYLFEIGADKVCINTSLFKTPILLQKLISVFGSQAIVASIQYTKTDSEVRGLRCGYGRDVINNVNFDNWLNTLIDIKPGEIILSNISRDGTLKGADKETIDKLININETRILYNGGVNFKDIEKLNNFQNIDGFVVAKALHKKFKDKNFTSDINHLKKDKNLINPENTSYFKKSSSKVAILDLGIGNIGRLIKAINRLEYQTVRVKSVKEIKDDSILCLPGVGNFNNLMNKIDSLNLRDDLKNFILNGRSIIAICLGMQILFESSEEVNEENNSSLNKKIIKGLGIIKGKIKKLKKGSESIPNIGIRNTLNINTNEIKKMYYIHSYGAILNNNIDDKNISETSMFNEQTFIASYHSQNIASFQYHPELSGDIGNQVLYDSLARLSTNISYQKKL